MSTSRTDWRQISYDVRLPTLAQANGTASTTEPGSGRECEPPGLEKTSDPRTWSPARKWGLVWFVCIANLSTTWATALFPPGVAEMSAAWSVSQTAVYAAITSYAVGFGAAPMFLAPFSEIVGRYPVILASGLLFFILVICNALDQVYWGMMVSRFFTGAFSSVFAVVTVGMVTEVFDPSQRHVPMVLFTAGAFMGSGIGPLLSGYLAKRLGWRWPFFIFIIFLGVFIGVSALVIRESRTGILLSRRAEMLNQWYDCKAAGQQEFNHEVKVGPKIRWKAQHDEERQSIRQIVRVSLSRPFMLLIKEPVVFFFSLWAAFAWSVLYGLLVIVAYSFQTQYSFSLESSNAVFASMCIATVISTGISIYQDPLIRMVFPKLPYDVPEARLYAACAISPLLPIGLFMFAWTIQYQVYWVVPVIALGIATVGMFSIYLAVFAYLSDAYGPYASSANAAQSFCRNMAAGAFPVFIRPMFQRLGFAGAGSLLGGLGILLTAVPYVLVIYGTRIRARSRFAVQTGVD